MLPATLALETGQIAAVRGCAAGGGGPAVVFRGGWFVSVGAHSALFQTVSGA